MATAHRLTASPLATGGGGFMQGLQGRRGACTGSAWRAVVERQDDGCSTGHVGAARALSSARAAHEDGRKRRQGGGTGVHRVFQGLESGLMAK
jgi:hypothetical protein